MADLRPPDAVTAADWEKVASALESAHKAWISVSPDSAGPVTELLRDARWNACVFRQLSRGVPRPDAWRAADAEHGRSRAGFINYEPTDGIVDVDH